MLTNPWKDLDKDDKNYGRNERRESNHEDAEGHTA
jgi:hypothetical protein